MPNPSPTWHAKIIDLTARRDRRTLLQTADDRGWAVRPGPSAWKPKTPLYLYVVEPVREQIITGVVNWEDLAEIEATTHVFSGQEIMDALTGMLAGGSKTVPYTPDTAVHRNEVLITLAARYVIGTETFRRVPAKTANAHFIVLVYRPKGVDDSEGLLRPFAVVAKTSTGLLSPDELNQMAQRVTDQDRRSHPDWFPSATVHSFSRSSQQ